MQLNLEPSTVQGIDVENLEVLDGLVDELGGHEYWSIVRDYPSSSLGDDHRQRFIEDLLIDKNVKDIQNAIDLTTLSFIEPDEIDKAWDCLHLNLDTLIKYELRHISFAFHKPEKGNHYISDRRDEKYPKLGVDNPVEHYLFGRSLSTVAHIYKHTPEENIRRRIADEFITPLIDNFENLGEECYKNRGILTLLQFLDDQRSPEIAVGAWNKVRPYFVHTKKAVDEMVNGNNDLWWDKDCFRSDKVWGLLTWAFYTGARELDRSDVEDYIPLCAATYYDSGEFTSAYLITALRNGNHDLFEKGVSDLINHFMGGFTPEKEKGNYLIDFKIEQCFKNAKKLGENPAQYAEEYGVTEDEIINWSKKWFFDGAMGIYVRSRNAPLDEISSTFPENGDLENLSKIYHSDYEEDAPLRNAILAKIDHDYEPKLPILELFEQYYPDNNVPQFLRYIRDINTDKVKVNDNEDIGSLVKMINCARQCSRETGMSYDEIIKQVSSQGMDGILRLIDGRYMNRTRLLDEFTEAYPNENPFMFVHLTKDMEIADEPYDIHTVVRMLKYSQRLSKELGVDMNTLYDGEITIKKLVEKDAQLYKLFTQETSDQPQDNLLPKIRGA